MGLEKICERLLLPCEVVSSYNLYDISIHATI